MKITILCTRATRSCHRSSRRLILWAGAGLMSALIALPAAAGVFPEQAALTLIHSDDFEDGANPIDNSAAKYEEWEDVVTTLMSWQNTSGTGGMPSSLQGGSWGNYHLWSIGQSRSWWSQLPFIESIPTEPGWLASFWTNIQIEVDIKLTQTQSGGFAWAMQDADGNDIPESGYIFRIRGITPASTSYDDIPYSPLYPERAEDCTGFELLQITAEDTYQLIARSDINSNCTRPLLPPTETFTVSDASDDYTRYMLGNQGYKMRLSWYCGNLRVQMVRIYNPVGTNPPLFRGCGASCGTGSTNVEDCWCTLLEWTPEPLERPLPPGAAGLHASGTWSTAGAAYQYFDNLVMSFWDANCDLRCDPWEGWQTAQTDLVPFKFLYEGGLFDISAGRRITPAADRGKIDVATEPPASVSTYNHSLDSNPYCNGWNLLQGLPPPTATGGNIGDVNAFLEPMHTAVKYESAAGSFSWVDDYDNNPASATYNPVPMVADGSTPINSSLLEAFDWYVDQKTVGDWSVDPYEGCRQWFVILITDGDEACEFDGGVSNPDAVCESGGAAEKFANPNIAGVAPLPVYTIGFSESVAADSPLQCIADITGGQFLTATNAGELAQALNDVYYNLGTRPRSFSPFKVAPPPSQLGGTNSTRDYLAVYPLFQPLDGKTLWSGNLLAYRLNKDQTTLPDTVDCALDTSQALWDAASALQAQIDAHTEANPQRFVYMGSEMSGDWARYDLATMPDDPALQVEFASLLDVTGGISSVGAQQVVNFLRYAYLDNDYDPSTSGPPLDPRPDDYPVLGEFFHSQPVIVNPPNNPTYFYDFGYGASGERGAHNYQEYITKHAKRRRMVLAGSNDGMLHAFDGGVWDRDRDDIDPTSDTYNEIHDLGNGTELFAWVPQAVMNRLFLITAGENLSHSEPLYTVDGPITVSDAFIDSDGDGDREWRTVALTSMRRGGRGLLALDITQPDALGSAPDYVPSADKFPDCRVGSTPGCDGEFPKVLWEFSDTSDEGAADQPGKCPTGVTGDDCAPYWDLGWTWSKPAVARIAVYNASNEQQPDDVFVAFFGGGWDEDDPAVKYDNKTPADTSDDFWASNTGNFLYGVDLSDGSILVKEALLVDVPGGVTALDSDNDGFHDRIYFADTDGRVWRLGYPDPTDSAATGADAGTLVPIFDFSADFPDRQEFFTRPVAVAAKFDGSGYTWALALGSGDRSDLSREDTGVDHFFFLLDVGDSPVTPRGAADLVAVDYTQLTGSFDCDDTAFTDYYGWYLSLRETEKVVFDASVIAGWVQFPTFDPTATEAVHNVPDQCGATPDPLEGVDLSTVCYATGLGRTYKLWYQCGLGNYTDHTDIITGSEDYTIGDNVYNSFTTSDPGAGGEGTTFTETTPVQRTHTTTNWRQE